MDSKKPVLAMAASQRFNRFLMSLDEKGRKWINSNMVFGRVFSFHGKFGVVHEDLKDPYDLVTKRLINVAVGLLEKNTPYYLDIETHFTGVDVIKLEPNKRYELNVGALLGEADSNSDIYTAEEASLLVSMFAYYFCLQFATTERFETGMRKYRECLTELEQSQHVRSIIPGRFFTFKRT
jgi:hypothetical protein